MTPAPLVKSLLGQREQSRIYGVTVGVVTNNKDPDNLGRVKVRFPWLADEDESFWARIATPMAGNDRGYYVLPEVDDEVLVAFDHGMIDFPYIIGGLWNGADKPPENNSDGKNNKRTFKSRSGHIIRFDDTDGDGKIEITDSSNNQIVIKASDNTITISAQSDIKITSSAGKVSISGMSVDINAQTEMSIHANANMKVDTNAILTVQGSLVKIN